MLFEYVSAVTLGLVTLFLIVLYRACTVPKGEVSKLHLMNNEKTMISDRFPSWTRQDSILWLFTVCATCSRAPDKWCKVVY